jgi:hypothetical protein
VGNYFYLRFTGSGNLRRHLITKHGEEYKTAADENGWKYAASIVTRTDGTQTSDRNVRNPNMPRFSPANFLEALVRFIVADDQVCLNVFILLLSHSHV